MRRTVSVGLVLGVLACSAVARAQTTSEEHRAVSEEQMTSGLAAYRRLDFQ